MKIATWNVNGIRARQAQLQEWLDREAPDVVCLQELKIEQAEFPHAELRACGYYAVVSGQQGWNGVAVISKEMPEVVTGELPGASEHGARFIVARTCGLEVASIYVPNGKTVSHTDFRMKLDWLDRLATYVEGRAEKDAPLLLGGDFNVCPTDLDSYAGANLAGQIFHTDAERSVIARIGKAGLTDLFRAKYPTEPGFSWWDYRAGCFHKNQGLRIDLLYGTEPLARRVTDVFVDRESRKKGKESGAVPSDHAPIIAVLE